MPESTGEKPLFLYTVLTEPNEPHGSPETVEVEALYFVEEKSYTFFKDGQHAVVCAVPTDRVLFVHRGEAA